MSIREKKLLSLKDQVVRRRKQLSNNPIRLSNGGVFTNQSPIPINNNMPTKMTELPQMFSTIRRHQLQLDEQIEILDNSDIANTSRASFAFSSPYHNQFDKTTGFNVLSQISTSPPNFHKQIGAPAFAPFSNPFNTNQGILRASASIEKPSPFTPNHLYSQPSLGTAQISKRPSLELQEQIIPK